MFDRGARLSRGVISEDQHPPRATYALASGSGHSITAHSTNGRFAPTAAVRKSEWIAMSAFHLILLQKSFDGDERNFLGPLMRFVRKDVRDLIAHQKNGHGASYRRHRVLQRRIGLKFDFREIFGVVRFSTFATLSPENGIHRPN